MSQTITYDKPFKTYEELLDLLKSRKFIIDDEDFAINTLKNVSYYTLINGYYHIFETETNSGILKEPVNFNDLYTIHIIDSSLSNILFKYILAIERALKSHISYIISKKYGVYTSLSDMTNNDPNDYLCRNNYSTSSPKRNNILRSIKKYVNKQTNTIVQHYIDTKNHIPSWILTSNLTFGICIEWYSILKKDEKNYVCNEFLPYSTLTLEQKKELLLNSLKLFREYRNSIAHGNRLFVSNIRKEIPKNSLLTICNGLTNESEYLSGMSNNGSFAVIVLLTFLLNDRYMVNNMMQDLTNLLMIYKDITFSGKTIFENFNLPNDLLDRFNNVIP